MNKKTLKTCFVISQIGEKGGEENRQADWFLETIVFPVLSEKNYEVIRADKITKPGMVDAQIIEALMDSDLVIADLTNLNANVFYEIGIRHAFNMPIIHMAIYGQRIPFDNTLVRTFFYDIQWPKEIEEAKNVLTKAVNAIEAEDYEPDNPVTRTLGRKEISRKSTPMEQQILESINRFSQRLDEIENSLKNSNESSENYLNISEQARRNRNVFVHSLLGLNPISNPTYYGGKGLPLSSLVQSENFPEGQKPLPGLLGLIAQEISKNENLDETDPDSVLAAIEKIRNRQKEKK